MPYRSKAQQEKFHSDPKLRKYVDRWDKETEDSGGFEKLPKRVDGRKAKPDPKPAHRKRVRRRA